MLNQSDLVLTQHMTHLGLGRPCIPPSRPKELPWSWIWWPATRWSRPTRGTPGPPPCRRSRRCRCANCGVIWYGHCGGRWRPQWAWRSWENHHVGWWKHVKSSGIMGPYLGLPSKTTSDFMMFRNVLGGCTHKNGLSPFLGANEIDLLQFCLSRGMGWGKPIPPKITCLD